MIKLICSALIATPTAIAQQGSMMTPWNQFGMKLENQMPKEKSAVYSPLSLWTALAMVEAGAEGKTKEELRAALAVGGMTTEKIGEELRRIGTSKSYEIGIANGLWTSSKHDYEQAYVDEIRKNFDADFESVDFAGATESARLKINGWVENETRGKIKDVIAQNQLPPETLFILANAIYFKGSWRYPFLKPATKEKDFSLSAKKKIRLPAMHQSERFPYFEDNQVQALSMPYEGHEMYFLVLLPRPGKALDLAGPAKAQAVMESLNTRKVEVQLPRFKIESALPGLKQKLSKIGIQRIFSAADSELGKIMKPARGPLMVSEIIHKAMIDVNEAGTEAAAATVVMMEAGGMPPPLKPAKFIADRPFRFYIVHGATKSILFAGQFLGN